jgi:3-deoxy-manno-octulosonate cytidylyltransferase (CMP-KDO synthetase)
MIESYFRKVLMIEYKVVGVIPARFQSSRFPGKVLAEIFGKSLVQMTYENMLKAELLSEVIVAVDDPIVFDHVKKFGGKVVMTSLHCQSGTDRVAEAVREHYPDADIVVNIQVDEPCLDPSIIDKLVYDLISTKEAVMTTPVVKITDPKQIFHPSIPKCVFDKNRKALYFSRSPIPYPHKDVKAEYYRHIGVYCFRKEFLQQYTKLPHSSLRVTEDLEQLKVLDNGFPIHISEVKYDGVEVNHPEDIKKVEEFLCANTSLLQEELSPPLARV